jgi:hypothetical protein
MTPDPGILELEVVVSPPLDRGDSFERLLPQYRMSCLYRYVVHTRVRTILRAKLAKLRDADSEENNVIALLEGLRRHFRDEYAANAA